MHWWPPRYPLPKAPPAYRINRDLHANVPFSLERLDRGWTYEVLGRFDTFEAAERALNDLKEFPKYYD